MPGERRYRERSDGTGEDAAGEVLLVQLADHDVRNQREVEAAERERDEAGQGRCSERAHPVARYPDAWPDAQVAEVVDALVAGFRRPHDRGGDDGEYDQVR